MAFFSTTLLLALTPLLAQGCGTETSTAWWSNSHYSYITSFPTPPCEGTGYFSTKSFPVVYQTVDLSSVCSAECSMAGPECEAYVYTLMYQEEGYGSLNCFMYSTRFPSPATCIGAQVPSTINAYYRDDTNSCFAESLPQAARYCSSLLGRDDPGTYTQFTATTSPTITAIKTSYTTKSRCYAPVLRREGITEGIPNFTGDMDAIKSPNPTAHLREKDRRRVEPIPPPSCIDIDASPEDFYSSACQCLTTFSGFTTDETSTAPATTKTIKSTITVNVLRSAVPTFGPQAKASTGDKTGYNLLSRTIKDKKGTDRRILIYTKPNVDVHGVVGMHVDSRGTLFAVTQELNNLKEYGQINDFFISATQKLSVLGQMSSGGESAAQTSLVNCKIAQAKPYQITCQVKDGGSNVPAIFSEVLVPGKKNQYMLAVGKTVAQGGKAIGLFGTKFGRVRIGCGEFAGRIMGRS